MPLAIRTRELLTQNDIITPGAGKFISTQADRCLFPGCINQFPHQHSTSEGKIVPRVEEYRKAGEAIRERWTEEQRRRIAENEAVLQQLAELDPRVGRLSIQPNLPRGNDLTVQEQISKILGGATPAQYEAAREMLLERQRQNIIDNTSPISPVSPGIPQTKATSQTPTEQSYTLEYDDFPELDSKHNTQSIAKKIKDLNASSDGRKDTGPASHTTDQPSSRYQRIHFLNTDSLCTGPCPVQVPHNQGAYLSQGEVPRAWNARWGYSDPPRRIWEAWVRIEQGRGSSWDKVEVDGFAMSHWWAGP